GHDDLPMLSLIVHIHPVLGHIMAVVIYAMIFNTALGMFYALARRLSASRPEHFYRYYVGTVAVGFVLSFAGFKNLSGWIYPLLGYMGLLRMEVITLAWVRLYWQIGQEDIRRLC